MCGILNLYYLSSYLDLGGSGGYRALLNLFLQPYLLTVDCATVSQNEHHARDRSVDFEIKSFGIGKTPRAKSLNEPAEEQP